PPACPTVSGAPSSCTTWSGCRSPRSPTCAASVRGPCGRGCTAPGSPLPSAFATSERCPPMLDSDTDQVLRAALRAEYDLAHQSLRPGGVEAVRAAAARDHRRRTVGAAGLAALPVLGGVAGCRTADSP